MSRQLEHDVCQYDSVTHHQHILCVSFSCRYHMEEQIFPWDGDCRYRSHCHWALTDSVTGQLVGVFIESVCVQTQTGTSSGGRHTQSEATGVTHGIMKSNNYTIHSDGMHFKVNTCELNYIFLHSGMKNCFI